MNTTNLNSAPFLPVFPGKPMSLPEQENDRFVVPAPDLSSSPSIANARERRWRRALLSLAVIVCSPALLPLICAFFPLHCLLSAFIRLARPPKRRRRRGCSGAAEESKADKGLLIQRYLEDQIRLAASAFSCDDDGEQRDQCI